HGASAALVRGILLGGPGPRRELRRPASVSLAQRAGTHVAGMARADPAPPGDARIAPRARRGAALDDVALPDRAWGVRGGRSQGRAHEAVRRDRALVLALGGGCLHGDTGMARDRARARDREPAAPVR